MVRRERVDGPCYAEKVHGESGLQVCAVSSADALDVTPSWLRAADGHDVDLPLKIMSYVEIPSGAKIRLD